MTREHAGRLLDRVGVLRHPCDLDLLVFFVRHPRTLMASEQMAAFLGYELKQISESLDVLLTAGLLTRTPSPSHAARMYVFTIGGPNGGWLPEILKLASTRDGRLALRLELARRASEDPNSPSTPTDDGMSAVARGARPFLVRQLVEPTEHATPELRRGGSK